jgi:hypothetical protein
LSPFGLIHYLKTVLNRYGYDVIGNVLFVLGHNGIAIIYSLRFGLKISFLIVVFGNGEVIEAPTVLGI